MPVYYHISLETKHNIYKNFSKNLSNKKLLFFSKKNSFWYNLWKSDETSYAVYKITIPEKLYTTSFNPLKKKIVRITKDNIDEFIKFDNQLGLSKLRNIEFLRKRNIIGIDANTEIVKKYPIKHVLGPTRAEGWIYDFKDVKIKKVGYYVFKK